jgi:hypothetical protein
VQPLQPGPPPALGSEIYLRDLAESRAVGAVDSTVRTPQQTAVARFWSQTSLNGFTGALRTTVAPHGSHASDRRPLAQRIALVALLHAAAIDAQITTYKAKYRYLFWRPVTAIPDWLDHTGPVLDDADRHARPPGLPFGHTTYTGAAQAVLERLAGPPRAPFSLTNAVATDVTLRYRQWSELTRDNIDARVWKACISAIPTSWEWPSRGERPWPRSLARAATVEPVGLTPIGARVRTGRKCFRR